MTDLILVLDAGTTSTRAMLFAPDGALKGVAQQELTQYYPQPGWVEHDAAEIWDKTLACARQVVEAAGGASRIAAIGITNQRETVVAWDKGTGQPLHHALVWQDRRTADFCASLRENGQEPVVQAATGLGNGRILVDLEAFGRRPCDRCQQCQPHPALAAGGGELGCRAV